MPMKCAVFKHNLVDGVKVTNPDHIHFIQKSIKDFRPQAEICRSCKNSMEYMYERKTRRAKAKSKLKQSLSMDSVSMASDQNASKGSSSTESDVDAIDRLVNKTPLHKPKNGPPARDIQSSRNVSVLQDSPREMVVVTPKRVTWQTPVSTITTEIVGAGSGASLQSAESASNSTHQRISPLNALQLSHTLEPGSKPTGGSHLTTTSSSQDVEESPLNLSRVNDVISPTIYENEDASQSNCETTVITQINNDAVPDQSATSNVRFSQEASTSAAARTASSVQTPTTSGVIRRRITDFLKPINAKSTTHTSKNSSPSTIEPSTSAAAVPGRKRSFEEHSTTDTGDDVSDDDEPRYSLSYYSGTRLPDVQPYVKKRPRQSTDVMTRYVADITGG